MKDKTQNPNPDEPNAIRNSEDKKARHRAIGNGVRRMYEDVLKEDVPAQLLKILKPE